MTSVTQRLSIEISVQDRVESEPCPVSVRALDADTGAVIWTGHHFATLYSAIVFRDGMQAMLRLVDRAAYDAHEAPIVDRRSETT